MASQHTRANRPLWSRALASAGTQIYAGDHWGMPNRIGITASSYASNVSAELAQSVDTFIYDSWRTTRSVCSPVTAGA